MKPFMMYVVGRSGSGKTTIANALKKKITEVDLDCKVQFIDGDIIRAQLGDMFGYTKEERMKCNRVVRVVVKYLIDNGISVVLTQVAAYEEMRQAVRNDFKDSFIEVYVKCSFEECARRDVKGYYKKFRQGEMNNLNGANDTYEVPQDADLIIDTENTTVDEAMTIILNCLEEKGYGI